MKEKVVVVFSFLFLVRPLFNPPSLRARTEDSKRIRGSASVTDGAACEGRRALAAVACKRNSRSCTEAELSQ